MDDSLAGGGSERQGANEFPTERAQARKDDLENGGSTDVPALVGPDVDVSRSRRSPTFAENRSPENEAVPVSPSGAPDRVESVATFKSRYSKTSAKSDANRVGNLELDAALLDQSDETPLVSVTPGSHRRHMIRRSRKKTCESFILEDLKSWITDPPSFSTTSSNSILDDPALEPKAHDVASKDPARTRSRSSNITLRTKSRSSLSKANSDPQPGTRSPTSARERRLVRTETRCNEKYEEFAARLRAQSLHEDSCSEEANMATISTGELESSDKKTRGVRRTETWASWLSNPFAQSADADQPGNPPVRSGTAGRRQRSLTSEETLRQSALEKRITNLRENSLTRSGSRSPSQNSFADLEQPTPSFSSISRSWRDQKEDIVVSEGGEDGKATRPDEPAKEEAAVDRRSLLHKSSAGQSKGPITSRVQIPVGKDDAIGCKNDRNSKMFHLDYPSDDDKSIASSLNITSSSCEEDHRSSRGSLLEGATGKTLGCFFRGTRRDFGEAENTPSLRIVSAQPHNPQFGRNEANVDVFTRKITAPRKPAINPRSPSNISQELRREMQGGGAAVKHDSQSDSNISFISKDSPAAIDELRGEKGMLRARPGEMQMNVIGWGGVHLPLVTLSSRSPTSKIPNGAHLPPVADGPSDDLAGGKANFPRGGDADGDSERAVEVKDREARCLRRLKLVICIVSGTLLACIVIIGCILHAVACDAAVGDENDPVRISIITHNQDLSSTGPNLALGDHLVESQSTVAMVCRQEASRAQFPAPAGWVIVEEENMKGFTKGAGYLSLAILRREKSDVSVKHVHFENQYVRSGRRFGGSYSGKGGVLTAFQIRKEGRKAKIGVACSHLPVERVRRLRSLDLVLNKFESFSAEKMWNQTDESDSDSEEEQANKKDKQLYWFSNVWKYLATYWEQVPSKVDTLRADINRQTRKVMDWADIPLQPSEIYARRSHFPILDEFDAVFVTGDLNFRLKADHPEVIIKDMEQGNWAGLAAYDSIATSSIRSLGFGCAQFESAPSYKLRWKGENYKYMYVDNKGNLLTEGSEARYLGFVDRTCWYQPDSPKHSLRWESERILFENARGSDHAPTEGVFSLDM